jgi:predicted nucleic acid-binding protein
MTRVADTSFLMALFDVLDQRQAQAQGWAADPEPIEVPSEVLAETLGVVHRRKGLPAAQHIWSQLIRLPHLTFVETTDVERIAEAFKAGAGRLSWVDAAVVAACRASDAKPLCFDPAIQRAVKR